MRIILLEEGSYDLLVNVVEDCIRGGFDPALLPEMTKLHNVVANARSIDFSNIGEVELSKIAPGAVEVKIPAGVAGVAPEDQPKWVPSTPIVQPDDIKGTRGYTDHL